MPNLVPLEQYLSLLRQLYSPPPAEKNQEEPQDGAADQTQNEDAPFGVK